MQYYVDEDVKLAIITKALQVSQIDDSGNKRFELDRIAKFTSICQRVKPNIDKATVSNMFIKMKYYKMFSHTEETYDYVVERDHQQQTFIEEISPGQDLVATFIDRGKVKQRGFFRQKT
jgi:hypothetical protein